MARRLGLLLLLAGLAAAGAAGIYWYRIPDVTVSAPIRGPAVQAVYATGVVEPVHWAKVTPLLRGRIAEICACEGQTVARGERLARLDDREEQAAISELEARATFLTSELERYRRLVQRNVASAQAYERAASDVAQVKAAIAAARERLRHLELVAPLAGVVLRKDGEVGEVVQPGEVLFWIGRERPLWIVAEVDEEDIPVVQPGQKVLIKADAFPAQSLPGSVERITPKGDPVNKNYRVRIALPDDTPLHIGMTTEINIVAREQQDALLVPVEALRQNGVFVVKEGRARHRTVETGIIGNNRAQIVSGLSSDDPVVTDPPAGLADGDRVRVREAP